MPDSSETGGKSATRSSGFEVPETSNFGPRTVARPTFPARLPLVAKSLSRVARGARVGALNPRLCHSFCRVGCCAIYTPQAFTLKDRKAFCRMRTLCAGTRCSQFRVSRFDRDVLLLSYLSTGTTLLARAAIAHDSRTLIDAPAFPQNLSPCLPSHHVLYDHSLPGASRHRRPQERRSD